MELTKSQMLNRIAELAKENAELKDKLDAYQMSENEANEIIAELKAENERLKEENKKLNKMTGIFSARLCKKYRTTLQEIKAIAEKEIYMKQNSSMKQILDLITKAEEE